MARIVEKRSGEWSPGLDDKERETVLAIAEDTLAWCVHRRETQFSFDGYHITDKLKSKTATFVTLKTGGMLRGCMGSLEPTDEMCMSVHDNAVNAALRDPRFPPVAPAELEALDVCVSLLSPIVAIGGPDEFKVGEHGIILQKGFARAVYLPEVAVEQDWTREETLDSLCRKAGLPADAWRAGAKFSVFSSVVLSE